MMRKIIAYKNYCSEFMSRLSESERKKIQRAFLLFETEEKVPYHYIKFMIEKDIYDVSAELAKELGEIGTSEREKSVEKAWGEYNAQILLDARKSARLTQAELAQRIGVDKGYISRVERGLTIPTVSTLYRIAAAMEMTVELRPI